MVISATHFKDLTNGFERRTDGLWTHTGKLVVRTGPVELPAGSIGTSELEAGAAQWQIGSYAQALAWTLPTASAYTETPIQVTATFGGYLTRFDLNLLLACPTKGARTYWGLMFDGVAPSLSLGAADAPEQNYVFMATGSYYATPTVGTKRVSVGVWSSVTGTLISNVILSSLYITEQRR